MTRTRPVWLAAAIFLLAVPIAMAANERVVPTESCGHFFMVPVVLGGDESRTLWMLLDTGAEGTVVSRAAVRRLSGKSVEEGARVNLRDAAAGPLRIHKLPARVLAVLENTPAAAAGLREGDLLTTVNGMPFGNRGCAHRNGGEPTTGTVRYQIRRGEQDFDIDLRLVVLVP